MRDLVGGLVPAEGGGLWAVIFNRVAQARRIASAGRVPWVPCAMPASISITASSASRPFHGAVEA